MGLTPKLVKTTFEAAGVTEGMLKARALKNAFQDLPKQVRTQVAANGIPKTQGEIDALQRKYKLTPKQVQTLVDLKDEAARTGISNIQRLMKVLNGTTANPSVSVQSGAALAAIQQMRNSLAALDGQTATTFITTVRRGGSQPVGVADGGFIRGPGTTTSDSIAAWLSDREFVQPADAVAYYGVPFMEALRTRSLSRDDLALASGEFTISARLPKHLPAQLTGCTA